MHYCHVMPVKHNAREKCNLALDHNGKFPVSKIMFTHNGSF